MSRANVKTLILTVLSAHLKHGHLELGDDSITTVSPIEKDFLSPAAIDCDEKAAEVRNKVVLQRIANKNKM